MGGTEKEDEMSNDSRKPFQIQSIHFNEDTEVTGLTAYMTDAVLDYISKTLDAPTPYLPQRLGDGRLRINISATDIMKVYRSAGGVTGDNPIRSVSSPVFHELNWVYCSLIAED